MSTNATSTSTSSSTTTTSNSNGTAPGFGPLPGVFITCSSLPIYSVTPYEHPSTVACDRDESSGVQPWSRGEHYPWSLYCTSSSEHAQHPGGREIVVLHSGESVSSPQAVAARRLLGDALSLIRVDAGPFRLHGKRIVLRAE